MAIALPQWRSTWVALIGYGRRRHWGLLAVQGGKPGSQHCFKGHLSPPRMTMHHTMFDNNCGSP